MRRVSPSPLADDLLSVLVGVALGETESQSLGRLVQVLRAAVPETATSVLRLEGENLYHAASAGLDPAYCEAIEGVEIGPRVGSCGTAAFLKERVIAKDISVDPRWGDFTELADRFDLRACWSQPIFDPDGTVLGTFAIYESAVAEPRDTHLDAMERCAAIASIVMQRAQQQRALEQLQARRAQLERLSSLSRLAGLVAHDFANSLQVLTFAVGEASDAAARGDVGATRVGLQDVAHAAAQTETLCSKLLAFSGGTPAVREKLDGHALLERLRRDLDGSAKDCQLSVEADGTLPDAMEVATELIFGAVAALVGNAADAGIGAEARPNVEVRLRTVALDDERLDSALFRAADAAAGPHLCIEVRGAGGPLDAATVESMFEPFYSTKPGHRGLGLSVVLGTARAHAGVVEVQSGAAGTGVSVLLPAF